MTPEEIAAGRERWQQRYDAAKKRDADFTTLSGDEVAPVYGPKPANCRIVQGRPRYPVG